MFPRGERTAKKKHTRCAYRILSELTLQGPLDRRTNSGPYSRYIQSSRGL